MNGRQWSCDIINKTSGNFGARLATSKLKYRKIDKVWVVQISWLHIKLYLSICCTLSLVCKFYGLSLLYLSMSSTFEVAWLNLPLKQPDERFDGSEIEHTVHNEGTHGTDTYDNECSNYLGQQSFAVVL